MAERRVNIFKVLSNMDYGRFGAYSALPDEDRKEVDGLLSFPALRWMSCSRDESQHADTLSMVNEFANAGYFSFGQHREMQHKLLCVAGTRQHVKHEWIAGPASRRTGKILELLRSAHPRMKDDEAALWIHLNGRDGIMELALEMGYDKDARKALEAECQKL